MPRNDAGELGECGFGAFGCLCGLDELCASSGQFGGGAREICSGAKLGVDLRFCNFRKCVGAIDTGLGGMDGFLCGEKGEVRIGGGNGDFETGAGERSVGLVLRGTSFCNSGSAASEIKGLPSDECANSAAQTVPRLLVPMTGPDMDGIMF